MMLYWKSTAYKSIADALLEKHSLEKAKLMPYLKSTA
jgi:hypothetical protein